jgi:hypothetical protein
MQPNDSFRRMTCDRYGQTTLLVCRAIQDDGVCSYELQGVQAFQPDD